MLYVLSISDIDFAKEYIVIFLQDCPSDAQPWGQLVEVLLREEFSNAISESLISPPCSQNKKEINKQTCHEKWITAVADSHMTWEVYIQFWSQVVPKGTVYDCLNAYYKGIVRNLIL